MWERNHTEAGPTCQPLPRSFFRDHAVVGKETRGGRLETDDPLFEVEGEEEKKGEEFQGKEGMSWRELSTGWRAPR